MKELGDIVIRSASNRSPPRRIRGEVVQVTRKTVMVRWINPNPGGQPCVWYYRGRMHMLHETPETRVAHHNLELVERKGGPW